MERLDKDPVKVPDNRNYEYAYNQSFQLAVERLVNINDYADLCRKSDCRFKEINSQKNIELEYLGRTCRVILEKNVKASLKIIFNDTNEEISLKEKILILHYILDAKGTPLSNNLITFKELPEGPIYFRTFSQRTIKHLVSNFNNDPSQLIESSRPLGGRQTEYGDIAVTINAFSRVPVTFVLWRGDSEFPPDGNILYDSSVTDYLPTEDIIVLTETVVWKLVKSIQ
jgi:hypothetical protein